MDPALEKYVLSHSDEEDQLLCELSRQTHLKYVNPRMVAGHLQGKILEMISKMIRPSTILEIGTFTGYSTICLAKGLTGEGIMHTIEINDELEDFTTSWFVKAGLADKIKLHLGDALSIIPRLNYSFDLVFIDGEKNEYSAYYKLVFDKVRPGGFILADNVLWSGKVVTEAARPDGSTRGILEFNEMVLNDKRVEKVIFPLRDGLTIIRKK